MKQARMLSGTGCILAMLILILDSRTALHSAAEGLQLCIASVIPSLFPFFVLSIYLTGSFSRVSFPPLVLFARMLRIPAGAEAVILPAFLGGYPAGAQCIGQLYSTGKLSLAESRRLLAFCSNPGPAFLFGVLSAVFPDIRTVWLCWGIQHLSAFSVSRLLIPGNQRAMQLSTPAISFPDSLQKAINVMSQVCGWIILFRIVNAYLSRWFLWILPQEMQVLCSGILELTNGCLSLKSVSDLDMRFLLCNTMLSFGGICVVMQTSSVIGELPLRDYLIGKLLQTGFSVLWSVMILKNVWYLIPLVLFCIHHVPDILGKNSSIPVFHGV